MEINHSVIQEILYRKLAGKHLDTADAALLGMYISKSPHLVDEALSEESLLEWCGYEHQKEAAFRRFQEMHPDFFPDLQPAADSNRQRRSKWFWASAAAAILLSAILLIVFQPGPSNTALSSVTNNAGETGRIKAVLTLDDQQTVNLYETSFFVPVTQGSTNLVQVIPGQLIYRNDHPADQPVLNKLTTLTGSNFQVVLADGTKVWLNAGSSLQYPTAFTGRERVVHVTGEAYFEVARKTNDQPFIVQTANSEIEVLGTHFNVSAYQNDSSIKTTLLEGAVKVRRSGKGKILRPGQQAVVKGDQLTVHYDPDAVDAIAWKEGYFSFNRLTLSEIMRKLERWYGKPFTYTLGVEDRQYNFYGKIPSTTKLESILKSLQLTNYVHFDIKNDTIIISK